MYQNKGKLYVRYDDLIWAIGFYNNLGRKRENPEILYLSVFFRTEFLLVFNRYRQVITW